VTRGGGDDASHGHGAVPRTRGSIPSPPGDGRGLRGPAVAPRCAAPRGGREGEGGLRRPARRAVTPVPCPRPPQGACASSGSVRALEGGGGAGQGRTPCERGVEMQGDWETCVLDAREVGASSLGPPTASLQPARRAGLRARPVGGAGRWGVEWVNPKGNSLRTAPEKDWRTWPMGVSTMGSIVRGEKVPWTQHSGEFQWGVGLPKSNGGVQSRASWR
jgi:hypothetical protein